MAKRQSSEVNAGSMADIAFLLLIFFLVTTTIASDKGLPILLPPYQEDTPEIELSDRNVFNVLINSKDELLVEEQRMEVKDIRDACKAFLSNNGVDPDLSDNPNKAVVSLKANRGTSYSTYLTVLDELTAAYNELRSQTVGLTVQEFLELDKDDPDDAKLYEKAKEAYPYQLSEAEPTDLSKLKQ